MKAAIVIVIIGFSIDSANIGEKIAETLAATFVIAKIPALNKGGKYSLLAK